MQYCLTSEDSEDLLERTDVHIHFPAGAVGKDGPSAGVTIVAVLVSLFRYSMTLGSFCSFFYRTSSSSSFFFSRNVTTRAGLRTRCLCLTNFYSFPPSGRCTRSDTAMTGEITLRGLVLPVSYISTLFSLTLV